MKSQYVAPSIEVLGSLSELTLKNRIKALGNPNDGDYLGSETPGNSLTTVS